MNKRLGKYIKQGIAEETYQAYVPEKLPPDPAIDMQALYPYLEKAGRALAELNALSKTVPNASLFVYMYVRKEALLSSQIEGTQSSLSDLMLFEHAQKPDVSLADVEEVSNYVRAITYGLERIKQGFPLSLRLLREVHGVLLSGTRGSAKTPGEFRRSQNWIGGSRPGNALFVPPPVDHLQQCLFDFEDFLYDKSLPPLVRAGLAHVQFETIHPFLDGNGRLGRLLIIFMLCLDGMIDEPILYISLYLKQHRRTYYNLLQEVRLEGNWETWLEFFLESVYKSAHQAISTINRVNVLFEQDQKAVAVLGRSRFSCEQILDYMKRLPQVTVVGVAQALDMSAPTARSALNKMVGLGILEQKEQRKREKVYVYRRYLSILEEGAEPLAV